MYVRYRRASLASSTILASLAGAASLLGLTSAAQAQDAPQESQLDDVVVTGSRIPQANLVTTSPGCCQSNASLSPLRAA